MTVFTPSSPCTPIIPTANRGSGAGGPKSKFLSVSLIFVLAVTFIGILNAAENDLPDDSRELIQKLRDWELEKQVELKAEISAKRQSVIKVLEQHLTAATRRGDLDSAIEIRKQIAALQPKSKDSETKSSNESEIPSLVGEPWTWVNAESDRTSKLWFKNDGTMEPEWDRAAIFKWTLKDDELTIVKPGGFVSTGKWNNAERVFVITHSEEDPTFGENLRFAPPK